MEAENNKQNLPRSRTRRPNRRSRRGGIKKHQKKKLAKYLHKLHDDLASRVKALQVALVLYQELLVHPSNPGIVVNQPSSPIDSEASTFILDDPSNFDEIPVIDLTEDGDEDAYLETIDTITAPKVDLGRAETLDPCVAFRESYHGSKQY
ncbi:uncharacterized protein LOC128889241 [Hylaeus anthracinus]|uniref:uncharacterized protein LOC128889241 n=1 Tax=Hylaeus anthracinus TaxID=313031 RepID=UPI0023B8EADE|nr:uncharacterized protein LOC128889241 [Hylaeus anthracinus]